MCTLHTLRLFVSKIIHLIRLRCCSEYKMFCIFISVCRQIRCVVHNLLNKADRSYIYGVSYNYFNLLYQKIFYLKYFINDGIVSW